jgi:hypothetical protein
MVGPATVTHNFGSVIDVSVKPLQERKSLLSTGLRRLFLGSCILRSAG